MCGSRLYSRLLSLTAIADLFFFFPISLFYFYLKKKSSHKKFDQEKGEKMPLVPYRTQWEWAERRTGLQWNGRQKIREVSNQLV
jgi:hypothetical protein